MPLVIAIDQGTTATKALAVDGKRQIVARTSVPTPLEQPQAGWAQNDTGQVLEATASVLDRIAGQVDTEEVRAIGITNQRETTAAWRASDGQPLGPAISWQCRRTTPTCQTLREDEAVVDLVRERTGLVIDPYFSATKMAWLLENIGAVAQAEQAGDLLLGTIDALLIHGLTGEHATDPSNASRTMAYDIHTGAWDGELMALLDLPPEAMPAVRPSAGRFGTVARDAPLGSQLEAFHGVPVLGVAGDQQASLFGHGCHQPGEAKGTLGTGAFFLANTGDQALPADQGVLTTVAWDLGDGPTYALEGAAFACGSALEWASQIGWLAKPDALDTAAGAVDDPDGVTFVPALYGLAAPHWDPDARGAVTGLSASTTRHHIARAIAEGLAAQNALLVRALGQSGQEIEELHVDGGVSRSNLLCQLMADGIGVPVHQATEGELTALGAASLAGLEAGLWTLDELEASGGKRFEPEGEDGFVDRYEAAVDRLGTR